MIYKLEDGTYVISSHQVWMPGVYDTERTANYAFKFSDEELHSLGKDENGGWKLITFEDLQELKNNGFGVPPELDI